MQILVAKDRELNKWCSLKKAVQYRSEDVEKYDVIAYKKKANNDQLKRRLLPSLYEENQHSDTIQPENKGKDTDDVPVAKNKKEQKESNRNVAKNKWKAEEIQKEVEIIKEEVEEIKEVEENKEEVEETKGINKEHVKSRKRHQQEVDGSNVKSLEPSRNKRKRKHWEPAEGKCFAANGLHGNKRKTRNKLTKNGKNEPKAKTRQNSKTKQKATETTNFDISDARLTAFGIKPKKFKNKLKYGLQT